MRSDDATSSIKERAAVAPASITFTENSAICQPNTLLLQSPVRAVRAPPPPVVAFRKIFQQLGLRAAELEGDSFHHFTRPEMDAAIRKARDLGRHISYFGPEANDFGLLEKSFIEYG